MTVGREKLKEVSRPGQLVEVLREQIARIERGRRPADKSLLSSGCGALDRVLPGGGFRRGTLVEWLTAGQGSGATTLALDSAREACREGGACLVLDRHREFYPPEAVRQGIPWDQLVVVHAANEPDHHWAMDQALGCPAVAAVLAWPERLDTRTFRRWQLAVEKGGAVGLLVRPEAVRHEPSWAEIRLGIEPLPSSGSSPGRRLRIHLLRCRGGNAGKRIDVEIDDETHSVYLVSGLAAPTPRKRAAGA